MSLRISDHARPVMGDHASTALAGGFLVLVGVAVGMALAEASKPIQGQIQEEIAGGGKNPPPVSSTPDLNVLISSVVAGFLK